jgi:hypothetical protein
MPVGCETRGDRRGCTTGCSGADAPAGATITTGVAVSATAALFAVGIGSGQRDLSVYAVAMLLGGAGVVALRRRVGLSRMTL